METQENQTISQDVMWKRIEKSHRRGKIMGGLLLTAIGSLFLARELGAEIPAWVFTWKMLLIGIGVVAAVKHKFLHPIWIILVGVGGAFLLNDIYPDLHIRPVLWPVLIILVGLAVIFKPRRRQMQYARHYWKKWHEQNHHWQNHPHWQRRHHRQWAHKWAEKMDEAQPGTERETDEDYVDSISFMGGVKKNILSKKFRGGDVVNIFGGAHINLSQADFEGTATLSITQIFGGTKLIVPSNWEIKLSETVTICGGIEDKRPAHPNLSGEPQRVLNLIGVTVFGGIEIKNYN